MVATLVFSLAEVFHSGQQARLDLTPAKARELGYTGGRVCVIKRDGDMVYVGLPGGDAWVNASEVEAGSAHVSKTKRGKRGVNREGQLSFWNIGCFYII